MPESEIVVRDVERVSPASTGREQERGGVVNAPPAQASAPREDSLRAKVRKAQAEREAPKVASYLPTLESEPARKRSVSTPGVSMPHVSTRGVSTPGNYMPGIFDGLKLGGERGHSSGPAEPMAREKPPAEVVPEPLSAAEAARAAQREELLKADSWSFRQAWDAASVTDRNAHVPRPMTVADAARLVSPDYAAVADRLEQARADLAYSEKAIETYGRQRDYAIDQGDQRWHRMGTLAQYGHRMGIKSDYEMDRHEKAEQGAAERLTDEEMRRAERLKALPDLERQEQGALAAVRPAAEAKLAQLQERAALAREVQGERMQLQQKAAEKEAQERKLDRSRSQSRGLGR